MSLFGFIDLHPSAMIIKEGMDDNDTPDYTKDTGGDDATGTDDGATDYTIPDDDGAGEDNDTAEPAEDDNDTPDYTKDAGGDDPDSDDTGDDPDADDGGDPGMDDDIGNEDGDDNMDGDDDYSSDDDASSNDDPVKDLQRDIFSNLTDSQMAIKDKELRMRFYNMYESIDSFIERINEIPKASNIIKSVEFVSLKLDELSTMINDYITYTYDTLTYVENEINYNKFFTILSGISIIIKDIGEINKK